MALPVTSKFASAAVADMEHNAAKTDFPHYGQTLAGINAQAHRISFLEAVDPNLITDVRFKEAGGVLNVLEATAEQLNRDEDQIDNQAIRTPEVEQQKREIVALQGVVNAALDRAYRAEDTFRPQPGCLDRVTGAAKKYWYVTAPVVAATYEAGRHYAIMPALAYAGNSLFNFGCYVTRNYFSAQCDTPAGI